MICPFCGEADTKVDDTRNRGVGAVRRRRSCPACRRAFATNERVAAENMIVRKRNGDRQTFARGKVVQGINMAAWIHNKQSGRDKITPADVNAIVDRVESRLRSLEPSRPVSSVEISRLVLEELRGGTTGMDVVCVRYAIVSQGRKARQAGLRGLTGFLEWLLDSFGPPHSELPSVTPWLVKKRSDKVVPFQEKALAASILFAAKGHGTDRQAEQFSERIASEAKKRLAGQAIVTSQQVAAEVLKLLMRERDALTYLRYASAVKRYSSIEDFWLEAFGLDPVATRQSLTRSST